MKAKLHKLIGIAVLGLALFSHSIPAGAGLATRNEVSISSSGTSVQGSLTGARYSADSEQYLGCDSHDTRGSTTSFVYCSARDNRGRYFACSSTDPRMADAVKGITDSSHLYIRISNLVTRVCTDLEVTNDSIYLP